jgi:hypothetical protein
MTQDPDYTQRARFTRELPVKLNEHELQVYGLMCASKVGEIKLAEEKLKQHNAASKTALKGMRQELERIANARKAGEELRAVECAERLHTNVIEIVRIDTGEVIDTRPAEITDLQPNLPGVDTDPPDVPPGEVPDNVVPFIDPGAAVTPGEVYDGAVREGEQLAESANEPGPGEGTGEPDSVEAGESDELIENAAVAQRDRDIAQRDRELAEDQARGGGKPRRERSAKARGGGKRGSGK